jgi:hypothetical protein
MISKVVLAVMALMAMLEPDYALKNESESVKVYEIDMEEYKNMVP